MLHRLTLKRGATGRYDTTVVGGEAVRTFVPSALPPVSPLVMDSGLQPLLEAAVLSSQIEGTQSSLPDLLLFELDEAPGVPLDDVVEVSNYVAALDHGLEISEKTGLSFPAASSAMALLTELGIARELTGKRRNRLFVYDRSLSILNEGTEPP